MCLATKVEEMRVGWCATGWSDELICLKRSVFVTAGEGPTLLNALLRKAFFV